MPPTTATCLPIADHSTLLPTAPFLHVLACPGSQPLNLKTYFEFTGLDLTLMLQYEHSTRRLCPLGSSDLSDSKYPYPNPEKLLPWVRVRGFVGSGVGSSGIPQGYP